MDWIWIWVVTTPEGDELWIPYEGCANQLTYVLKDRLPRRKQGTWTIRPTRIKRATFEQIPVEEE